MTSANRVSLAGQSALVIGGTSGIGKAIAIGYLQAVGVEPLAAFMKAHHVVGAGENDAFDAMPPRAFINMEDALAVGFKHFFEGAFHRDAAHVNDGVAALDQCIDRRVVGQVAAHNFVRCRGRLHRRDVGQPKTVGARSQPGAQHCSKRSRGAGQQQSVQVFDGDAALRVYVKKNGFISCVIACAAQSPQPSEAWLLLRRMYLSSHSNMASLNSASAAAGMAPASSRSPSLRAIPVAIRSP